MKTVTALFDAYEDAAAAVRALEAAGIASGEISLVVSSYADEIGEPTVEPEAIAAEDAGVGAGIGAVVGGAGGLLAGLGAIAIPGIGPVIAAGWLLSTAIGAVAGAAVGGATGGIVGSLAGSGVHENDAQVFAEAVRRGGNVVSVRTDEVNSAMIEGIFDQFHRVDINERRRLYEGEGWERFDPDGHSYAETAPQGGPLVGNFRGPY